MISSVSLPSVSLYAANFSGNTVKSPPCHVRSKPFVISASATATAEPQQQQQQQRASYLNMNMNSNSIYSSPASLYEILGISAGASVQEIKSAYRRLARVCHPDVAAIHRKNSSADDFMKIHSAYSTLSDPEKRANYDRSLFRRQRPMSTMMSSGYSSRKWETDQCW